MARKTTKRPKVLHPLNLEPETRARELVSLSDVLAEPVTENRFAKWVGASVDRKNLLADMVWGSIEWRKSLGKPHAPSMAAGFEIKHLYETIEYYDRGGGIYDEVHRWRDNGALAVVDGPHDERTYRVRFYGWAPFFWVNRITVEFSGVAWESPLFGGRYRTIRGSPREFRNMDHKWTVLAPMRVESAIIA